MSYNNDYSDDFQSEHYDDFSEQYSIRDAVLNDLIRISKGNNIKALRQYITLHKSDLKGYKTRLLNNVVPLDGYKFVRRDDKLMIIKLPTRSGSALTATQSETPALTGSLRSPLRDDDTKETVVEAAPKEELVEDAPKEEVEQNEPNKVESVDDANSMKVEPIKSNLQAKPFNSYIIDDEIKRSVNEVSVEIGRAHV